MTRSQILDAAALIFSQKGFHATSMQDIADAVSLQKASLYHHVSSKQEILLALLDQALDLLIERMQAVMTLPLPIQDKLRQAMRVYLQTICEHRELAAVLLLEYRSLETDFHARHLPRRDRFEKLWKDLIQTGLDEDVFHFPDPGLATRSILGVMNWSITWFRDDGPLTPEAIADHFADLFLSGLLARNEDHG